MNWSASLHRGAEKRQDDIPVRAILVAGIGALTVAGV